MQSLAWSTVVILVLLLPGFFFFTGLYMPEQFARDVTPRNPLGTLAAVVLVAFLSHGLLSFAAPLVGNPVDWEVVLETVQLGQSSSMHKIADAFEANHGAVLLYVLSSSTFGGMLGFAVGSAVVSGRLRVLVKHSWTYGFKLGPRDKVAYVHVLMNVENDSCVLQYLGRLVYFNLNADGTFAYVVLAPIEQRFVALDGKTIRIPSSGTLSARREDAGASETPAQQRPLLGIRLPRIWGRRASDVSTATVVSASPGGEQQESPSWRGKAAEAIRVRWSHFRHRPPRESDSLLVIHGAHIKSVGTDVVYEVENVRAEASQISQAADVLQDPTLTKSEKIAKLIEFGGSSLDPAPFAIPVASVSALRSPQEATADVQRMLHDLRFKPGPADGKYGPLTRRAVMAFQSQVGIPADGEVGERTMQALLKAHADANGEAGGAAPMTSRVGS